VSTAPATIGPYRVVRELGRGGMGIVFEAEPHACPGARYALKLLVAPDARARERFRREGELLSRVDGNRNVVRVHATGEDKGRPFLVLDLVEGESLEDMVARGPVPWPRALELMEQVANGLAAVHERGILHRDLKPSNVLVDKDGLARLTDFGIANADDLEPLTRTGALVGTADFVAPEILRGQRAADARCDLWALGACLYELLTGERPYPAASILERARMIETMAPRPPGTRVPGIPAAVDRFVLRLLASDPKARPGSARECAAELAALRRSGGGRRPLAGIALVLVAILAAGSATLLPARRTQAPELAPPGHDRPRHAPPGTATAHPTSGSDTFAAAIARARAARGTENPDAFTAIDDPSILARHADQVASYLAEARAADPSREIPSELVAFIVGAGGACGRRGEAGYREAARVVELAIAVDPGLPAALNEAAFYESLLPDQVARAARNARALLAGNRASPEQRSRAFELAVRATSKLDDHAEARKLAEQGIREFPGNFDLLHAFAEEQLLLREATTAETTAKLVAAARDTDTRVRELNLHARALVDCAQDGRAALAALADLHAVTGHDGFETLRLAVRAHLLAHEVPEARRTLAAAHAQAEKEGIPASDLEGLDALVNAAGP
jgi:predicted Ser/Thr protein kinase